MNVRRSCITAALAFTACAASPAFAATDGGWDWMVAPYGWAAGISADLQTAAPPSADLGSDTEFDDIVDKIDGAFQMHVEGQGDRFGVFADFTYLGLGDETDRERFRTEADLDTRLFEIAAVWSPGEGRFEGLDVFAGLRYIDVDMALQVDPVNPDFTGGSFDSSESFSDLMIGARYSWQMSERWGATLRGDGSFGDTDGTWNVSAVAQYKTRKGAWLLGYRYLNIDLQPAGGDISISMSGPMFGYGFKF